MKKRIVFFIGIILLGITSCKKEVVSSEPPYIEQWWDEFYGTYQVFDTLNDTTYKLEILQLGRYFDGESFRDSILVKNFANRFDINKLQTAINAEHLSLGSHFGISDRSGNKWALFGTHYWNDSKDTLKLFYTLSNIAFYMEDDVPYYECECTDLAVKIE